MLKRFLLCVCIIILSMTSSVYAADWVQLDVKLYADNSSIKKYMGLYSYERPNTYTVWLKWLNDKSSSWREMENISSQKLWYNKELAIVDCDNNEYAIRSFNYYDLKGQSVSELSGENSFLQWNSVIPESLGESIYSYTCSVAMQK